MSKSERRARRRMPEGDERTIAQYLKERIYATITGLAIVLVISTSTEHHDARGALFSVVIGVLGITAAGYLADVIAHIAVHSKLLTAAEQRVLLRVALGGLSTVVTPVILLALAWVGVMELDTSLRVTTIVYLVTLGLIGFGAVRRANIPWWAQLGVLASLVGFGALVVGVQVLAHSV
ncbi:MAG: hypothetical protein ACOH19_07815 [Rhodoglobus sp.]